ncbi:MAG: threonine synthase [Vicinamibacteria bacterium]
MMIDGGMKDWKLVCLACGRESDPDGRVYRCACGGVLDIEMVPPPELRSRLGREESLWRYRAAIPVDDESAIVTLGEGQTPLIEVELDGNALLLKLEYRAPTGSFKDRGASVLLSRLKEMRIQEILEDSSGNAGCSIAAYAAAAGIRCRVLVPEEVTPEKAVQIKSYGAVLERVPGSREEVAAEAMQRSRETYYASHSWQPFFLQGTKTFAYEIFEQADPLPEAIVFPVGNGTLLLGAFKGFSELLTLGLVERIPRLIAVQAASYDPVYARLTGRDSKRAKKDRLQTIAKGIAVRQPVRLEQIVEAIRLTEGAAVAVRDDEIRDAQRLLARRGLLVEPTSAAALAGYRVWERTHGGEGLKALLPLTGSGVKDLASFEGLDERG